MPELTIKYSDSKTLDELKKLAKSLNFSIKLKKDQKVKEVSIIKGDPNARTSELKTIFSNSNFDAKQLRKEAWSRKW